MNFILDTDSYKLSHFLGYPADAEHIYSYAESRGGKYPATVWFGIQRFAKMLADVRITHEDVAEYEAFAPVHGLPVNPQFRELIGKPIPVRIKAAPEGLLIPTRNVLATVENTDPRMAWLTSYIETALLRAVWYPTTVATRVHTMKQRIKPFYESTGTVDGMGFGVLDFSARGCSSRETAEVGGMAHLLSFIGSDNLPAIMGARRYYDEPMAAYSVAATEHSVTTSWGREGENASIEYLIDNMMPEGGILSMVADTYNVYEFVHKLAHYQDRIANKNGTVVIRPDSGEMQVVLRKVIADVRDEFWNDRNEKGYLMPRRVKVLQGDGINESSVALPFEIAKDLGVSADAIMTGSGGGLMQADIDRDTCKFAFKASNVTRNGVDIPIAKDPITDPGKRSKMGRLKLVKDVFEGYTTVLDNDDVDTRTNQLRTIYENGKLSNMETFATIRERLANQ